MTPNPSRPAAVDALQSSIVRLRAQADRLDANPHNAGIAGNLRDIADALAAHHGPAAVDEETLAVLRRLRDALPSVGLNGWSKGVAALDTALAALAKPAQEAAPDDFVAIENAVRNLPPSYAFADAVEHASPIRYSSAQEAAPRGGGEACAAAVRAALRGSRDLDAAVASVCALIAPQATDEAAREYCECGCGCWNPAAPPAVQASIEAPTGQPAREWTPQEKSDAQAAMQRIHDRESAQASDTGRGDAVAWQVREWVNDRWSAWMYLEDGGPEYVNNALFEVRPLYALCGRPPAGWYCGLAHGHDGPCPAWPVSLATHTPASEDRAGKDGGRA